MLADEEQDLSQHVCGEISACYDGRGHRIQPTRGYHDDLYVADMSYKAGTGKPVVSIMRAILAAFGLWRLPHHTEMIYNWTIATLLNH